MSVTLRAAREEDYQAATQLLLQSGERLLTEIFGNGDVAQTCRYLAFAWQQGPGQYGFQNHWVAESGDTLVGLLTCWDDQLPADFDRATLSSITDFFGLDQSIDVVMRSQRFSAALHPPMATELGIGHLAVAEAARRQGVGRALMNWAEQQARQRGKFAVVLDVASDNQAAIAFYRALGFARHQGNEPFMQMVRAVPPAQ